MREKIQLTGNSMEELFCKPFEKEVHKPLTDEEMKMLMQCLLMEDKKFEKDPEFQNFFPVKVMNKRLELIHNFELDNRIMLFLMSKFEGSIACYVMTLAYIQYVAKKKGLIEAGGRITMDHFCENIFPLGMPDDDSYHKVWVSLKHTSQFFERPNIYESITL